MYAAQFLLTSWTPGSEGDPECIFLLITHTKELLLVTVCDDTAGIGSWKGTAEFKDGNPHTSRQYLQINKPRRGIWADRREE